jgi:hypothetical protein
MSRDRGADPSDVDSHRYIDWATPKLPASPRGDYAIPPIWRVHEPDLQREILRNVAAGTIIQWNIKQYTYVALKTSRGWYTSATYNNPVFEPVMTDNQLANVLGDIPFHICTAWEEVNAPPF